MVRNNISLLLVMFFATVFANAQELKYRLIENTADQLEVYNDNETLFSGEITIPSKVEYQGQELSVTRIAQNAFENSIDLTAITIPASVTQIGINAFKGCKSEKFTIARFASEEALCGITFGNKESNPLYIAHHLYLGKKVSAETTFTVPNTINQIKDFAFVGCRDITSFTLSEYVNSIGQDAFEGCTGLTEVRYQSLDQMKSIVYGSGNSNPMVYAEAELYKDNGQYVPITSITFNANVNPRAFRGAKSLVSITFGSENTIKEIGDDAFYGCTGLTKITIPSNINKIGTNAFRECSGLTTVVIQTSFLNSTLPVGIFRDCSKLTDVTLSSVIETIGDNAFWGCTKLSVLPSTPGLITIGKNAFSYTGFTSLEIPATVEIIDDYAFSNCANLANISFVENESKTLSIHMGAFSSNSKLSNIYSYRKTAPTIADGDNPFGKTDIQLFTPSEGTTGYEGEEPWRYFTPASYGNKTIKYYIDNVLVRSDNDLPIGTDINEYEPGNKGEWTFSEWKWKNSENGSDLNSKPELMPNYNLEAHGYYTKDSHVYSHLYGDLEYNLTYSLKSYPKEATLKAVDGNKNLSGSITVPQSISITDEGFVGNYNIVAIETDAFKGSGIEEISLPASITTMGKSVFMSCSELKNVVFHKDMPLTTLPEQTFDQCSKLESFKLPTLTTTIERYAFRGCSSLKYIVFSDTDGADIALTTISNSAFLNCARLKSITLPSSISTIGNGAFSGCQNVNMITINSATAPNLEGNPFSSQIYPTASLYVKDVDEYKNKTIWKDFKDSEDNLHIYPIGEPHQLIYMINGNTQYGDPVPLATGKPIVLKEKLSDVEFTEGRDVSDWECEYEIMPNTDVYVNCSLKYHLTYKNKVTGTEICSEDLFYGQDITDPNDLKKKGFTYEKEIVQPTETESITKMPASDVVYNVIYSLTQKPTAKNITYTGNEQELINAGSVDAEIGTITYSTDDETYITTIPKRTNAGDYTVYYKVEGITASEQIPDVKIKRKVLASPTIILGDYDEYYDGSEKKPTVTVTYSNTAIPSSEYTFSYTNNTNAGNAQVNITNNDDKEEGNFTIVNSSKTFQIKKANVVLTDYMNSDGTPTAKDITYDGNEKELINAGSLTNTSTLELEYSLDNKNYDTTIPKGTDAKSYTVYYRVKGTENYNASNQEHLTAKIKEMPIIIAPENIILEDGFDYAYDGTAKKPDVVSVKYGDMTFTKGTHFNVSYSNNTNVGEATLTLTDIKGNSCNYEISGTKTFTILPERSKLTKLPTSKNNIYNGSDQDLVNKDGTAVNGKMQYSLSQDESSFSETVPKGKNAGSYTVYCKVKGDANHSDSEISSVTATIAPREITSFTLSASSYVYDGSEKKPTITVTYSNTTVSNSEYTVSYTNNINAGTATVTLTDKEGGNFNIHGSKTFTITKANGSLKQKPSGIASLTYNGNAQNLITAGSSETGTVEYSLDKTNYGTTIPTGINAKSYTVYYRVKGDANHKDANSGSVNVTIAKAALTISAGYYEIYEGGAIPEFTISYEGFKNNETEAVLTTKPTVSCKATTNSKSGEYAISVSGAKADNYNITHQNGKLVIMAMKFVSGGDTSKDTDDAATYQITSTESRGSSTPTVAITDDKEVSGAFAIPETVTYYNKTYTVTEIGESAFENNKNLTEVVIPRSITGIGNNAFKGCVNLQAITVYNPTPINLSAVGTRGEGTRGDGSIFDGVNKTLCILYVPDESVELYKKALVWRDFLHIVPLSTNTTGINGITQTEDEPFDIYNLQGQKVKSKATNLNGLPKGIYIINGKKYAVK